MPISLRVQRMKGKQSLSGCWPFLSDLWPHFVVVVVAYLLFFLCYIIYFSGGGVDRHFRLHGQQHG